MTPDQLNEIERRTNSPGYQASTMHADTIALLALVRELERHKRVLTEKNENLAANCQTYQNEAEEAAAWLDRCAEQQDRAEKAEARVKELESYLDVQHAEELQRQYVVERDLARKAEARVKELESDSWWAEAQLQTARVAVLREAIHPYAEATGSYCWGEDDCAFLKEALATLDPAATALTERLKAAEAVCHRVANADCASGRELFRALAAWRKVKGNHG